MPFIRFFVFCLFFIQSTQSFSQTQMDWIQISKDKASFVFQKSNKVFIPRGFNYDHDWSGRLLEDYWERDWDIIEADFQEMKDLGANTIRIHLQVAKFMDAPDKPNEKSLARLEKLVALAEKKGLYLDLTGLGCYHRRDVPIWYEELDEEERWNAQTNFWEAIASRFSQSSAILSFDLMNEPIVPYPGPKRTDWLGPDFDGKSFVQFIALETKGRQRHEIAQMWINKLVTAIKKHDPRHLITVGLMESSFDGPGLTSGFNPEKVAQPLDFLATHIYPAEGKISNSLNTLKQFKAVGKPVLIEEMFPLKCTSQSLGQFVDSSKVDAAGWIGFYWGKTLDEYRPPKTKADKATIGWLELFRDKLAGWFLES